MSKSIIKKPIRCLETWLEFESSAKEVSGVKKCFQMLHDKLIKPNNEYA